MDLFTYMLGKMTDVFFAGGKPNYSRYMTLYYFKLINIEETHPGLKDQLSKGSLSVLLSSNSFARQPVDMVVECTVNADAASRLTGISSFTQSLPATRQWALTRAARGVIVQALLEKASMSNKDNPSHELRNFRIKRDNQDLASISAKIDETINPFTDDLLEGSNLYVLSTGKSAPEGVKEDLLKFIQTGEEWKQEFIEGCTKDLDRFEKPIKRRRVKNPASAAVARKVKGKDAKLVVLKTTTDLLGRLVYLACTQAIDLARVFEYPLTPLPLCLAGINE